MANRQSMGITAKIAMVMSPASCEKNVRPSAYASASIAADMTAGKIRSVHSWTPKTRKSSPTGTAIPSRPEYCGGTPASLSGECPCAISHATRA